MDETYQVQSLIQCAWIAFILIKYGKGAAFFKFEFIFSVTHVAELI